MGVRLDVGERVFFVDENGHQVPQVTLAATLACLALQTKAVVHCRACHHADGV